MRFLPRHWLFLLLAALAVQAFSVACGGDEGGPTPTTQPTVAATGTPAQGETAVPTAAPTGEPVGTPTVAPGPLLTIDLATTAPIATIFAAEKVGDQGDLSSDIPAVATGDFNGDGVIDLLVGARFGDGPDDAREDGGEAYVIFGSSTLSGAIDIAEHEQDVTILGARPGDSLGYAVAGGDLNDDGIDDIIVGAPNSDGPFSERTDPGEAYVIFGSPDLSGTVDLDDVQADVRMTAAEGFSHLGDSLCTGDVNGDGLVDLVVGATFAGRELGSPVGGPRTHLGEVYVVFGSPTLAGSVSIGKDEQDFTIAGKEAFGELGDSVACGDVNGDGIVDIIAGAEAADGPDGARSNAGEVYVFFGSEELGGRVDAAGDQQLTILGADPQDTLGFSLASGDVNGDGIDDIIVAARLANGLDNARNTAGEVYVIFGSSSLEGTVDIALSQEDVVIVGGQPHILLGSVTSADVNGDGIDDIIAGTRHAGREPSVAGTLATGEAYIVFGSSTLARTIDLALNDHDISILGAQPGDGVGAFVLVDDVNDDGANEIILVADGADGPDEARPNAGEVYILSAP
jgi:hypothetical protein